MRPRRDRLTREERALRDSVERGEWRSLGKESIAQKVAAAHATLAEQRKEARVNLRLNPSIVEGIKALAAAEGIAYQTFIGSVLHKFVTGKLVDRIIVDELKDVLRDKKVS